MGQIFVHGRIPSRNIGRIFVHGRILSRKHGANIRPWTNSISRKRGANTRIRPWTSAFSKTWANIRPWTNSISKTWGEYSFVDECYLYVTPHLRFITKKTVRQSQFPFFVSPVPVYGGKKLKYQEHNISTNYTWYKKLV